MESVSELLERLLPARLGFGPLLQRDYWGVIRGCRLSPSGVNAVVVRRIAEFPPAELVNFRRADGTEAPLAVGDELRVHIRLQGTVGVRVLHQDACSLTLGTLRGHPEAGRITFGAYRDADGRVVFHIRSRARARSRLVYAGFLGLGEAMQTECWAGFVNAVALAVGDGVDGVIEAVTTRLPRDEPDRLAHMPTFAARGD
jgi:hypothetical protein